MLKVFVQVTVRLWENEVPIPFLRRPLLIREGGQDGDQMRVDVQTIPCPQRLQLPEERLVVIIAYFK